MHAWFAILFAIGAGFATGAAAQSSGALTQVNLQGTSPVCDLIGLGAIGSVPFNFPGADANALAPYRASVPRVPEATLPPGDNPDVPRVLGGDLGAPFLHGDGRIYFTFGDAFPAPQEGIDPAFCPVGQERCGPLVYNDDLLATAASDGWTTADDCIDLQIDRAANNPQEFRPVTWNGGYEQGGAQLGPGIVPGPGFSTGRYIFLLMPGPTFTCSPATANCAAVGGIEGDQCFATELPDVGHCYFGECAFDALSPCALRLNAMTLAVREQGSNMITPRLGTHIASQAVNDAYRGHFSTASFASRVNFETGDGTIWVVGRDSFWGGTGITMSPYLMYHPVTAGQLGEPKYFAGMNGAAPVFSSDRKQARPIYTENKVLNNHTSIMYEPELDGGTWLMLYGGHQSPSLRPLVGYFVRPVPDELFYGREGGVYLRWAKQPWGPWSEAITIFNPYTPGQGGYCEKMYFDDPEAKSGFNCSFDDAGYNQTLNRSPGAGMAGEYGAAFVPAYTSRSRNNRSLTVHWLLSTWNPYRVMLMKTDLATRWRPQGRPFEPRPRRDAP